MVGGNLGQPIEPFLRPPHSITDQRPNLLVQHARGCLIAPHPPVRGQHRGDLGLVCVGPTFPVAGVIKGWQEVLPLMKEGAKWQVYIPAELAYGPRGAGDIIGPNEVLVFDIELLSVKSEAEGKDNKESK